MPIVLALLLAAGPSSDEIVERWPDGGVHRVRSRDADGGVTETAFYTTGARWVEVAPGLRRTWDHEGWLSETMPLDQQGLPDGLTERFQRDGGLIERGLYRKGKKLGEWQTYWSDGKQQSARLYGPQGTLILETIWTSDGWMQRMMVKGTHVEFLPDGGVSRRVWASGLADTYRDGRLVQQEQRTKDGVLLLNAWGPDGGQEIRDGNGSRIELDGELGTPLRVKYRDGKRVR